MKVSIIIPIYNVAAFIERCLLSVLNQTWQDIEIILVNDCTPDNSMNIVATILEGYSRASMVKIVSHQSNKGLSAARNTGIREATGDYVYFLDSDDYLPLNSIELLVEKAQNDIDFIVGDCKIVGGSKSIPPLTLPTCILDSNAKILSAYAKAEWPVMAWNKLVNRVFLLQNDLFFEEGIVHEDDLWTFMMACRAQRVAVIHKVSYFYYIQPNSITGNPSIQNLECRLYIIGFMHNLIINSNELRQNKWVYITFETMKAKYFDRILYFTKDKAFRFQAYCLFRDKIYISPLRALIKFNPNVKLVFRNIHYLFPVKIGYWYFKTFVKLSYYFLVFPIKLKQWINFFKR